MATPSVNAPKATQDSKELSPKTTAAIIGATVLVIGLLLWQFSGPATLPSGSGTKADAIRSSLLTIQSEESMPFDAKQRAVGSLVKQAQADPSINAADKADIQRLGREAMSARPTPAPTFSSASAQKMHEAGTRQ